MRMSRFYMPTLKENPGEAEITSHKLLLRAGMIRKSATGIYSFLPLGYNVVKKIERIVREEMDRVGAMEINMSALQPKEIWEESGRWAVFGPEMFKLKDRHEREFCLGPTAEEYFTTLVRGEVTSYKQLPLMLYQIVTKYRDEKRPRFGINRAREFLMKDAYSFDVSPEEAEKSYMLQWQAYERVFDRLGLEYRIVQGDSGAMGGNKSHEFIALSEIGEGVIAYCDKSGFAATDEKAEVKLDYSSDEDLLEMEEVETPGTKTMEAVVEYLNIDIKKSLKAIDLRVKGEPVIVFIPGDRELNMAKFEAALGIPDHEIEMLDEETIRELTGAEPGFTGPVGLKDKVKIYVDRTVTQMKNMLTGANHTDHHIKNVNYGRDFEGENLGDILMAKEGDLCPICGEPLIFKRGIEVGNIFLFGDKYSKPLGASFLDENGKEKYFSMGSYGIGITRSVTAIIEQYNDEKGIIWPLAVAPYHAIITIINNKDQEQTKLAEAIYQKLLDNGIEVLLDDRKDRAGAKFADRDLIGIPLRITVGKKAAENTVEFSERKNGESKELSSEEAEKIIIDMVKELK